MHQLSKNVLRTATDPMCVPQLMPYDRNFRDRKESFARAYREHIEFVLTDPLTNPDDIMVIY